MRDMKSARRRTLLMFLLLVMFGALAIGYLLTFHLDTVRRLVQQHMLAAFGQNLKVEEINVTFLPYPMLTLNNLQIHESGQGEPFFQAARIQMDLSFLSVMQDEVVPKGLIIEDPEIFLRRNEQGQWNVESIFQTQSTGSTGMGAFLTDYSLTIENGFIRIVDAFEHSKPEQFELNSVVVDISNLSAMKQMEVSFFAYLNKDQNSQFSFQGQMAEIGKFFSTPELENPSGPNINVRTQIELSPSELAQLVKVFHIPDTPPLSYGRIKAQSQVRYGPSMQGYELILSDVVVLSEEVDLQGQASIAGLLTNVPPTISATWSSAPINVKTIVDQVPSTLIPLELQTALEEKTISGNIEVVSATVSGSSREDMGFGLIGEFKLSQGYVDLGKTWGEAEKIQGTVFVQPDRVQLKEFEGMYDSIPVSSGTGEIEFRDTGPWLSTELQGSVSSKKLIDILTTIFGWTNPDHAMAGFVGESGGGEMRIQFAGPLTQPDQIGLKQARYEPKEAKIFFPGIAGPIRDVSGTVTFSQSHVSFESVNGVLGSSPLTLQGMINLQESPSFDNLQIAGRIAVKDFVAQFKQYASPIQEILSGTTNLTAAISGPLDKPRIQAQLNLNDLEVSLEEVLFKKKGVQGTLETDFDLQNPQRLNIRRVTLTLPPITVTGKASLGREPNGLFTASVTTSPFELQALSPGLTLFDDIVSQGSVEFSLKIEGKGDDWRQWNKNGWIALTNGVLAVDGLNSPLSEILLRTKFSGHVAEVQRLQFRMKESQARIAGLIKNWEIRPKVKFELNAPQFDIDLLVPKGERSPVRDVLESIAATQTVEGSLNFGRAWYKDIKFQGLKGRLRIKDGIIGADRIEGNTEPGKVQGRFLIHLPVQKPATVRTWVNIEDVPLEPLQTTFLSQDHLKERLVTGNLSIQGMVQGHGKDARGIFPTLNGDLQIFLKDGRIRRGTVIPKMLALMNIPAVLQGKVDLKKEGYPFDEQSATISIKNGLMTSQNIRLDGPILKLTGAGTYDLVEDDLDLAVAASPLGPYFNLLRKISLFRLLLEGDQESIDMALFEVKGPLNDPVVKPLPLESFKTGLTGFAKLAFNVLRNTVTLPKNILFPEQTTETDSSPSDQSDVDQEF